MAIKLPVLLDSTLRGGVPLHPSAFSATIKLEPVSTASLILPLDDADVGVRSFVRLYGPDDTLGVFRVTSVQTVCGKSQEITLEHAVCTLEDSVTPEDAEYKGSFRSVLQKILNNQTEKRWTLGTVAVPDSDEYTLKCSELTLLQAVLDVLEYVDGYALEYDQSSVPWKLNVVKLSSTAKSECRMSRNADYVSISRDDAELVTRVYSDKLPDGQMDGTTIDTWGIISRHLSIPDGATESQAKSYARKYLDIHKNPAVSVEIEAARLVDLTGDEFDRFALGDMCNVVLQQWGFTLKERIVVMHYPDMLSMPDAVTLTLSTPPRSLPQIVAQNRRRAGGASRAAQEAQELISLQAENIQLLAAAYDETAQRLSAVEIILDGDDATIGLIAQVQDHGQKISEAYILIDGMESEIELKADLILLDGYVTATRFNTEIADIDKLLTGAAVISFAKFNAIQIDNTYINSIVWKTITVNGTSYSVLAAG